MIIHNISPHIHDNERNEVEYHDCTQEHFKGTHMQHWMIISNGYF